MGAIYLIRHGQASFGADDYDNLSDLGRQQSRLLGKSLTKRDIHIHSVFCGSMRRHRQTAESCLNAMNLIRPIRELDILDEYNHVEIINKHAPQYPDMQALRKDMEQHDDPWRAFQELYSKAMLRWIKNDYATEYSEPWPHFQERCTAALAAVAEATETGQNILVFTSGGPISSICQDLLGLNDERTLDLSWALVNTGVTKVNKGSSGCRLSVLNEHTHLDGKDNMISYR